MVVKVRVLCPNKTVSLKDQDLLWSFRFDLISQFREEGIGADWSPPTDDGPFPTLVEEGSIKWEQGIEWRVSHPYVSHPSQEGTDSGRILPKCEWPVPPVQTPKNLPTNQVIWGDWCQERCLLYVFTAILKKIWQTIWPVTFTLTYPVPISTKVVRLSVLGSGRLWT